MTGGGRRRTHSSTFQTEQGHEEGVARRSKQGRKRIKVKEVEKIASRPCIEISKCLGHTGKRAFEMKIEGRGTPHRISIPVAGQKIPPNTKLLQSEAHKLKCPRKTSPQN